MNTTNLLQSLSEVGLKIQNAENSGSNVSRSKFIKQLTVTSNHIQELRSLEAKDSKQQIWDQLSPLGISLTNASQALAAVLSEAPQAKASQFAAWYMALLATPGCPVLGLFDRVTCAAYLKTVRDLPSSLTTKSSKKKTAANSNSNFFTSNIGDGEDGDAMDIDDEDNDGDYSQVPAAKKPLAEGNDIAWFVSACTDFSGLLSSCISFKDQPDLARSVAETFSDVLRCAALVDDAAEGVMEVLLALMSPAHGGVREMGAVVLRLLGPHLMGQALGKAPKGSKPQSVRTRALHLTNQAVQLHSECVEAVAALTRHIMLRCPDKADNRTNTVDSVAKLSHLLSAQERQQLVVFIARLSRTSKVSHRVMAVDVSNALLNTLNPTFDPAQDNPPADPETNQQAQVVVNPAVAALRKTGTTTTTTTPNTVGGTPAGNSGISSSIAPWSIVCLAVLTQRAGDKVPSVRSKALGHIASITASHTGAGEEEDDTIFKKALAIASVLNLTPQPLSYGSNTMNTTTTPGSAIAGVSPALSELATGSTPMAIDDNDGLNENNLLNTGENTKAGGSTSKISFFWSIFMPRSGTAVVDLSSLMNTVRRRCRDEKGLVRKSAVNALQSLLILQATTSFTDIEVLEAAAGDVLVSVRKTGGAALHALLKAMPTNTDVAKAWVMSGLPLVRDVESSVQDAACEQVDEVLLAPAANLGSAKSTATTKQCIDSLLAPLTALGSGGGAAKACLARALAKLKEKNRLKSKPVIIGLERFLEQAHVSPNIGAERGAWLLYAELAQHDRAAPSWKFLQQQWSNSCTSTVVSLDKEQHQGDGGEDSSVSTMKNTSEEHVAQLLRVIAAAAAGFPADQASALCNHLLSALRSMSLGPAAAAAHISALFSLTAANSSTAEWQSVVYGECEATLGRYVDSFRRGEPMEATFALTALFTCGEVAILKSGKAVPSQRLVTLVQALTSPTLAMGMDPHPDTAAVVYTVGAGDGTMQADTAGNTKETDEDPNHHSSAPVPAAAQAHAWVALGKLCLVDERLAKKCVPLFVQELGRAGPPAVRNNIMVGLADLVVHYTALVDAHIGRLADCIRDPNELVRTQAVALLANLLQKDYVKWKGALFHRFLLALVDESPKVVALAEFLLGDALATKLPNMAYNRFLEVLFVLNDCHVGLNAGSAASAHAEALNGGDSLLSQHHHLSGSSSSADRNTAFTLKGSSPEMRAKRDALYKALLVRMPPEHKFSTAARLCQEVLGSAADGSLPFEEPSCEEVIGDALRILCLPEIKVSAAKAAAGAAAADEGDPLDAAAVAGAAKGKLVSQMMRKHLVESVVPIIGELKRVMEEARHPLLGSLMSAAAALLKEYKNELEDILAGNRQLAREILFDIKQAEEAAKEEKKALAASVAAMKLQGSAHLGTASRTPGTNNNNSNASGGKLLSGGRGSASCTPGSFGGFNVLPAGTSGSTPIAAEVLMQSGGNGAVMHLGGTSGGRVKLGTGGRTFGGSTAGGSPVIVIGRTTPGAGTPRVVSAGTAAAEPRNERTVAFKTPGGGRGPSGLRRGGQQQASRPASRLARASGPAAVDTTTAEAIAAGLPPATGGFNTTNKYAPGSGANNDTNMEISPGRDGVAALAPGSAPRLRKTPGSAAGRVDLRATAVLAKITTKAKNNRAGKHQGGDNNEEEDEHVTLPFAPPGTAEKKWNVSPAVVPNPVVVAVDGNDDVEGDEDMMMHNEDGGGGKEKEVEVKKVVTRGGAKRPQRKRKAAN